MIILDLDETLLHATPYPHNENWDIDLGHVKVYKRPGLDLFLTSLKEHFEVAVWSSAPDEYVQNVVKHIFPADYGLQFVWGRSRCTPRPDYDSIYQDASHSAALVKLLNKVKKRGYTRLEKILMVDDTPSKGRFNYGNLVCANEFRGDSSDDDLPYLLQYLVSLKDVENVRKIDKRNWEYETRYKST